MKISTLLNEDANSQAQLIGDIQSYLVRLKANSIFTIGTDLLVRELNDMGHTVTPEALVDIMRSSKYISKITPESIVIVGAPTSTEDDSNREAVKRLATKATDKRIG
ncbi:hypothetical protein N9R43_01605 [bacterium]|nr:hypothetical protein [bacterium]